MTARFAQGAYQLAKKEVRGAYWVLAVLWGAIAALVAAAWRKAGTWESLFADLALPVVVACIGVFAFKGVIALTNLWVQLVYLNERNDWVDEKRGEEDLDL